MLASLALWACAGVLGVRAAISAGQIVTGQTGVDGDGALAVIIRLANVLYVFLLLVTVVLVSLWFHRATRHAFARGVSLESTTPAGAVMSWFIPILNLVVPFNTTRLMLRGAGLESASVTGWQAMCLAGTLMAIAAARFEGTAGLGISVLSDLLLLGAGMSGAQIVNRLKWPAA